MAGRQIENKRLRGDGAVAATGHAGTTGGTEFPVFTFIMMVTNVQQLHAQQQTNGQNYQPAGVALMRLVLKVGHGFRLFAGDTRPDCWLVIS